VLLALLAKCVDVTDDILGSRTVRIIGLLAHEIPSYLVPNFSHSGEEARENQGQRLWLVSKLHYFRNGAAKTKDCGLRAEIMRTDEPIEGGRTNKAHNVAILERA
tara:strand:+ start:4302 stop:4616 length:315 start_codon:yes stop_codon:yes gene_type:complete